MAITDQAILNSLNAAYLRVKSGTANTADEKNVEFAKKTHGWAEPKLMTIWQPRTGEKKIALASGKLPVGYQLWRAGDATHEEAIKAIHDENKKLEEQYGGKGNVATLWDPDTGVKRIVYRDENGQLNQVYKPDPDKKEWETKPTSWADGESIWKGAGVATGSDARDAIFKKAAARSLRTGEDVKTSSQKLDGKVSLQTLAAVHGRGSSNSDYWKANENNVLAQRDEYVKDTYGGFQFAGAEALQHPDGLYREGRDADKISQEDWGTYARPSEKKRLLAWLKNKNAPEKSSGNQYYDRQLAWKQNKKA